MSPTHSREARQPGDFPADAITVNLVRLAGLTKDKARECEAIVRQVLAALPPSDLTGGEEAAQDPRMAFCPACFEQVSAAEADQQTQDARRYRWLRNEAHPDYEKTGLACTETQWGDWGKSYQQHYSGEALDVAVDRAADLTLARSFAGEDRDYPLQRAVDERGEKR